MRRFLALLIILGLASPSFASPDTTMSVTPAATAGQVITAADENDRNNDISTAFNSHSHADIGTLSGVNTLTIGDGTAGAKTYAVNDAQATDPALRYNNSVGYWQLSTDGATFDAIGLASGNVIAGNNDFRIGDNTNTGNKQLIANEASTDGVIRWLTASDRWELSNDASNFAAIQTVSGNTIVSGINEIQIGDATTTAPKYIYANTTSTIQDPSIRYNPATSKWELTHANNAWKEIATINTAGDIDAWVKFNGSGTIQDSTGVTSVTRDAQGDYTVTFTSAFANAHFAYSYLASNSASALINQGSQTQNTVKVLARDNTAGTATDPDENVLIAIGDN